MVFKYTVITMENHLFWSELQRKLNEDLQNLNSPSTGFQSLLGQLENLTRLTLDNDFRKTIPEEILQLLLKNIQHNLDAKVTIECVRILRNCSGQNWEHFPQTWTQLLNECIQQLKSFLLKESKEDEFVLGRVILQCIANLLNASPNLSTFIWENLQNHLENLISHSDEKINLFSSCIMYGVLRDSVSIMEQVTTHQWRDLTATLIRSSHQGVLYSQFSIQLYLKDHDLLEKLYGFHGLDTRLLLLHQISEFIPDCDVDFRNWRFFSQLFQERAGIILRTCESSSMDLEAMEVSGLVEILAKSSSGDVCHKELFMDDSLLVATIDLLRSIHSLGKAGTNYFTNVEDHFGSVEPHPALNFKCNLVRLLGNLCFRNQAAQDRVRELEAIAPLLECCNLDARNPFIQQWSVLAIRNLCERNISNQDVISSMTRRSVVQPAVLEDLGMIVEESASGLTVRSSDSAKM